MWEPCLHPAFKAPAAGRAQPAQAWGCLFSSHFPEQLDPAWKASSSAGLGPLLGTGLLQATQEDGDAFGDGELTLTLNPCPFQGMAEATISLEAASSSEPKGLEPRSLGRFAGSHGVLSQKG